MNLGTMYALVSQRLNEAFGAGGPTFYPTLEIVAALNEAQRTFALLTLILEVTAPWTVPANTTFTHMLGTFADWIVPLRVTGTDGRKIRPARLDDLVSLDSTWFAQPGTPIRYAHLGADLVALYRQPAAGGTVLNVTYSRAPVALVNDADVPEVPVIYHPALCAYGVYRLRQVEGAEEFSKALPLLGEYLDAAQKCGAYVRARNRAGQYDKLPLELELYDRSQLLKLRSDLVPRRKVQA